MVTLKLMAGSYLPSSLPPFQGLPAVGKLVLGVCVCMGVAEVGGVCVCVCVCVCVYVCECE